MTQFEPDIIGFMCNWCAYAGADLAGTSKIQYPANIRIVRVMCSGRIGPEFILDALRMGADGVFIGGCHLGDCHYEEGNYKTALRVSLVRKLLRALGMEPERVRLEWISASEGEKFSRTVEAFVEEIRELGPSPLRKEIGVENEGERPGSRT